MQRGQRTFWPDNTEDRYTCSLTDPMIEQRLTNGQTSSNFTHAQSVDKWINEAVEHREQIRHLQHFGRLHTDNDNFELSE